MTDYDAQAWHLLVVERVIVFDIKNPSLEYEDETDYRVEHPPECDKLKYGEQCAFDACFFEDENKPDKEGSYRARVIFEKIRHWEGDEWNMYKEWFPLKDGESAWQ